MSAAALSLRLPRSVARDVRVSAGGKKARKKSAALKSKVAQQPPVGGGDVDGSGGSKVPATAAESNASSAENYGGLGYDGDNAIPYGDTSGASIKITDAMLSVGDVDLLSNASVLIMPGQKVALVGGNGCGKSTLLKCIAGKRSLQDGTLAISRELSVGYFEQTAVSGSQLTVYEEARSRMDRVNAAEKALREAEAKCGNMGSADEEEACRNADELMDALAEFDMAGGHEAEKKISNVLDGLGFARSQWDAKCDDLSGGWQMRVALARLLLSPAGSGDDGLLLLDEPTNHLDEAAKTWLAKWIKDSPCTTVIVSHEQELMDGACDHVAEVRGRGLHWYTGNFADFLEARDERIAVAKALYEKQLAEEADLKDFIRRFSANASKSTQAQSRAKLLEKLQKEMLKTVSAATATVSDGAAGDASAMNLKLAKPPPSNQDQLRLIDAKLGYTKENPILSGSLTLSREMRVVVLGPNGAGKSTLLKSIAGTMALVSGEREVCDERVKLGVFSQDLAQYLPKDATCLEYVMDVARQDDPLMREEKGRAALGALGITGTMALRKIGSLSGGEKARVALAAFVLQPRNCLLLDEPSNHLDVGAVKALTDGLQGWDGCLFAVSHNKAFCESLNPTHVVRVKDGSFVLENCYGLTDADFEHEEVVGDATARALETNKGSVVVQEEKEMVAV
jgi:ATPase subunit of ABC transporter with duplicated ATPase domains